MKTADSKGKAKTALVVTLLVGAAIFIWRFVERGGPALFESSGMTSVQENGLPTSVGLHYFRITKIPKEVRFGLREAKAIEWAAIEGNVPFIVKINGGEAAGGKEYLTPPRDDWARLNWQPPYFPNIISSVSFKLPEDCSLQEAQFAYDVRQK